MASKTVILGTGNVLPEMLVPNSQFESHEFYDHGGVRIERSGVEIVAKL